MLHIVGISLSVSLSLSLCIGRPVASAGAVLQPDSLVLMQSKQAMHAPSRSKTWKRLSFRETLICLLAECCWQSSAERTRLCWPFRLAEGLFTFEKQTRGGKRGPAPAGHSLVLAHARAAVEGAVALACSHGLNQLQHLPPARQPCRLRALCELEKAKVCQ